MIRTLALVVALLAAILAGPHSAVAQPAALVATEAPAASPFASEEALKALAEVLKDDKAREALLAELERLNAGGEGDAEDGESQDGISTEASTPASIGRRIADASRDAAEGALTRLAQLWGQLRAAPRQFDGLQGDAARAIIDAVIDLALIIAATALAFIALRRVGRGFDAAMGARAVGSGMLRTTLLIAASVLIDAGVVLLAWATGYVLAIFAFGEAGALDLRQTLYLNAFLAVEMAKVVLRAVLSPHTRDLRPIPIPDRGARTLNLWIGLIVSLLGYGQLLLVPIVSDAVHFFAGQSLGVAIALIALLLLAAMTLIHRRRVAIWLLEDRGMGGGPRAFATLARGWHTPVLLYLAALFLVVLTRPGGVLLPMLGASAKILAAVILGSMAAQAISRSIARGVRLPEWIKRRLPALERRLNMFVPKALSIVRGLILLAVLSYALNTLGLFSVEDWLESQFGATATAAIASVLFILLVSFVAWLAIASLIDFRLNPDFGSAPGAREQTLLSLARNAVNIVMFAVTVMFILSELGIDIAPLIASAGVIGLAIGFGAQKLVQDIITGIFIQFENAMNVGDVVQVGGTVGTVEKLTIRSVSLRDVHGVFHIIPFSSVDMVSNYMREYGMFVCDMGVAYREDIDVAKQAMLDGFEELRASEEQGGFILEDMTWFGLQAFGDNAVVLRSRIKTVPGKQWGVGRAYNAILKRIFDERGIEIPFPHQTIYFGEDRDGNAPAARVTMQAPSENLQKK